MSHEVPRGEKVLSRLRNIIHLVAYRLRPILMVLALAIVAASMAAHAQDSWQIDPKHSVATLSLGSGANQLQIGLAPGYSL